MEGNFYEQTTIPETSTTRYITDFPALNIPAPEDTTGDWHFDNMFFNVTGIGKPLTLQLAGEGEALNTNHIYGSYGIHECSAALKNRGITLPEGMEQVWAANHFRAVLDMAYESLTLHDKVMLLTCAAEDYFDTAAQKIELLTKACEMLPFLTEKQGEALKSWICGEWIYDGSRSSDAERKQRLVPLPPEPILTHIKEYMGKAEMEGFVFGSKTQR
jgi:hypothetical protein